MDGALLSFDDTQGAFVPAPTSEDYLPILVRSDPETSASGILLVRGSGNDTAFAPQYLALLGPRSKGRYRVVASEHQQTFDPGASFMFDDWQLVEYDERVVLRYGEDEGDAGYWVMAKRGEEWVLWWIEPAAGNDMGDLGEYVLVDVEAESWGVEALEGPEGGERG